jgi:hypothetical protein
MQHTSDVAACPEALTFVASAIALLRFRLNSAWLIGGAALIGLMVKVP